MLAQRVPERKTNNERVLNADMCKEVYDEIALIFPALEYCLAPKKDFQKSVVVKDTKLLEQHAKTLYDWLDLSKVSRVRMLLHWQAGGGHAYVASVYQRAATVFRYHGNSQNDDVSGNEVSLAEFQEAIVSRHQAPGHFDEGMSAASQQGAANDFR